MAGRSQKTVSLNKKVYEVAEELAKEEGKNPTKYITDLILNCKGRGVLVRD